MINRIILLGLILLISCDEDNPVINEQNKESEWLNVTNGLPTNSYYILESIGDKLFVLSNTEIYSSANNGESWERIGLGLPDSTRLLGIAGINEKLAMLLMGKGVYTSIDFGKTWIKPANNGLELNSIFVGSIEMDSEFLFIGAGRKAIVYRSSDFGQNWIPFNEGLPMDTEVHFTNIKLLKIIGAKLFAIPAFSGIYYSENNGEGWQSMNEGLPLSPGVPSFSVSNSYYYATIMGDRIEEYGLYRRGINGSSWDKLPIQMTDWNVHFVVAIDETILVSSDLGIEISYDDGNTWEDNNFGLDIENRQDFSSAIIKDSYVFIYENYNAVWRNLLSP